MATSPLLNSIKQSDILTQFIIQCKQVFTSRLGVIEQEEKKEHPPEDIKERNFALEKEHYKEIIRITKQLHVLLVYGKNKCDYPVYYNNDRNISSAICSLVLIDIA